MRRRPAKRHTELAILAAVLTVVVVAFGVYTMHGLFSKKGKSSGRGGTPANPAFEKATAAYEEGRFEAARDEARRAAKSADAATVRSARLIEARALSELGDPEAREAWSKILDDATFLPNQRAEAAARLGELCAAAEPPDLTGAIAAYSQAIERFPGTHWGDWAAMALADAHIADKHPERAEAVLTDYAVKAKEPEVIQEKLGDVNIAILLSPLETEAPKSTWYSVEPGDTLAGIARRFHTTVDLLAEGNNIVNPQLLQVGDRLKVITDSFRIVIDRSDNTLSLFCHDKLIKKYSVGTGEYGKTPLGEFTVASKDIDPMWRGIPFGDERNILGTRWMRITDPEGALSGYGIHGTWQPETIGKHSSQGCVRMLNEDVEELFKIVTIGTPVMIVE
jgi:lipoprotein-anchoring transpeptidase ErfK/SrfK